LKVKPEYVGQTLVTLCAVGGFASFILHYRQMRLSPGFPDAIDAGALLLCILLVPIIWVKSLRTCPKTDVGTAVLKGHDLSRAERGRKILGFSP
jgi:hypothetical protein